MYVQFIEIYYLDMCIRRNFSRGGKVDILLRPIFFSLLTMQCKWTYTERFPLSTPYRKLILRQQLQTGFSFKKILHLANMHI